jgi:predicted porin
MKKSLIALAVAGAFAAPAAFAASANVDVYGIMNVALQDTDVKNSDLQVTDNFSRVGLKGSEDLGGGLKGVWQIESGLGGGTDGMGTGSIGTRNTFVGLAGDFGTAVIGRHDTPYKLGSAFVDIFGDTIADYNLGRLDNVQLLMTAHDARTPNAIAYISPTFSGFHFAAAVIATNAAANGNSNDTFDGVSLTGVYANGPLTASLSYQKVEDADAFAGLAFGTADESAAVKLAAAYAFGDTTVGFAYEDVSTDLTAGGDADRDSWLLNVKHAMGPITLKAQYGSVDAGAADQDQWALGADYALSKRTTAYFVYGNGDDDNLDDVSGWNLGVKHSF